jgi:hypothetical protein
MLNLSGPIENHIMENHVQEKQLKKSENPRFYE